VERPDYDWDNKLAAQLATKPKGPLSRTGRSPSSVKEVHLEPAFEDNYKINRSKTGKLISITASDADKDAADLIYLSNYFSNQKAFLEKYVRLHQLPGHQVDADPSVIRSEDRKMTT